MCFFTFRINSMFHLLSTGEPDINRNMSRGNSEYDLRDENQVKEYLKNVLVEYQFSCFKEKDPTGMGFSQFSWFYRIFWSGLRLLIRNNDCYETKERGFGNLL